MQWNTQLEGCLQFKRLTKSSVSEYVGQVVLSRLPVESENDTVPLENGLAVWKS